MLVSRRSLLLILAKRVLLASKEKPQKYIFNRREREEAYRNEPRLRKTHREVG